MFWGKRELHLIPERQLKKLVFGLKPCDEVVDDDEVKGKKGTAPDVDDLQAGEGKEGQLVHLCDEKLKKKNIATGKMSLAITPFHFFAYFN